MNSYRSLCAQFYDIDKPTAPKEALQFYFSYARDAGGPTLEPMCGTGRFLLPMLEAGCDVDGMDGSPEMLAACKEKCSGRGFAPALRQQLLHELDMPRKYAFVFIPSGSFNLVAELSQVREGLNRIHDHMLPGGRFVFETGEHRAKESSSWPWGGRWVERPDGAKIIISWLGHYDAATHLQHDIHRYELVKDGHLLATEVEEMQLRQYEMEELRELLEVAGFVDVQSAKVRDRRATDAHDEEVIVECRKA